ncbi:MAG: hypothetical protein R3Y54_00730 [Eubacteriales bacterium]
MLSKIKPFDTANNKPYKPEYIAGYAAQRYSIGLKESWETAKRSIISQIKDSISSNIRRKHNASQVSNLSTNVIYDDLTYKYLLLPIWSSSFKYKNKIYHFMVNEQTGRVAGNTPISPWCVAIAITGGIIVVGLIYFILYT